MCFFFFSSRRRHTRCSRDWSSDVCSSDLSERTTHEGAVPCNFSVQGEVGTQRRADSDEHDGRRAGEDRKSTRLNSSHGYISYAVFFFEKKKKRTEYEVLPGTRAGDSPAELTTQPEL